MVEGNDINPVERFLRLRQLIPDHVRITAVSKFKPVSMIADLFSQTGHKLFGENKAQELTSKYRELPSGIEWHFIGHLQTNKVKLIAPFVSLIQSVDSFKLLAEINKEALNFNRIIPVLLQFHIATEETKFGFSMDEALKMLNEAVFDNCKNVSICGVMGMATFTDDTKLITNEFRKLYYNFTELKNRFFAQKEDFCEISMGMSDDYRIAIAEGSTMVRIGSGIFGNR